MHTTDNDNALVPKLRFPEFEGEWLVTSLGSALDYEQPSKYIVSSDSYDDSFPTPVLTAGKSFLLGRTDEEHGIFSDRLPVIIFDDFTTATKFVDFPFKIKSSAIKILKNRSGFNLRFLHGSLERIQFKAEEHKRHWISFFSQKEVPVPTLPEQQKIADCLSSLDELISAECEKLELLKSQKKGLMQQLFPQEGETVPRLRFPEFENDGDWVETTLGEVCSQSFYGTSSSTDSEGKYPVLRMGNMSDGELSFKNLVYIDLDDKTFGKLRLQKGDILFNRTNSIDLVGKVSIFEADVECLTASYIVVFRPDTSRINSRFLNTLLNTELYQSTIRSMAKPSVSQANVNPTQLKSELRFSTPSLSEQERISSYFGSINKLITETSELIEHLRAHKQALMQQLFPSMNEAAE